MGKTTEKCPLCGKKMRVMGASMACGDCCYIMSNEHSVEQQSQQASAQTYFQQPDSQTYSQQTYTQKPYTGSANMNQSNMGQPYAGMGQPHGQRPVNYIPPTMPNSMGGRRRKNTSASMIIPVIIALVIVFVIFGVIIGTFMSARRDQEDVWDYAEALIEDINDKETEMEEIGAGMLESEMFKQLVTHVFGKDYADVTTSEMETICFMEFGYNETGYRTINYKLADGSEGSFYYDDVSVNTADLAFFTGLEVLHIEGEELERGDLMGLDRLTELWCGNSFEDIADIIDPAQLTSVGISTNLMFGDMEGIEYFTHITSLRINNRFIEDISNLNMLTGLKNLQILRGDSIESFNVLYDMSQLETLHISSGRLRDIGFVSNMSNLRELTIEDSEILDISSIAECKDTLTKLNLTFNYQVGDYSPVLELTKLTELTLYGSSSSDHNYALPDLSAMKNLKKLAISVYDDISSIDKVAWIEELTLHRIYGSCDLSKLTNLKTLNLIDMSVERSEIETMTGLKSLEKVDLTDTFVWANIEEFMNLPNLKEIDLTGCTAGFDVSNLKENKSLQVIIMDGTELRALVDGQWDYTVRDNIVDLTKNMDIFKNYPGLRVLSIPEIMLNDISFVQDLPELRILDITNNYVTDLSPLKQLSTFEAVLCYQNPVTEDDGEGGMILDKN